MNPWAAHAHLWHQFKPPLRPDQFDLDLVANCINQRHAALVSGGNHNLRVLILGATAEYHALVWPPLTQLMAVDYSQAVLDHVWPGTADTTLCANWLELTPAIGRFDLVLGDGCLCQLGWPADYTTLVSVLHQLMNPGALLLTRAFVRDAVHENFTAALAGLRADPEPAISKSKLRLWLAAQPDAATGISTRECWQQLLALGDDFAALAAMLGDTEANLRELTLRYLNRDQRRFHYPTEAALVALFSDSGLFTLLDRVEPPYPLGRNTPTLVFRTTAADNTV